MSRRPSEKTETFANEGEIKAALINRIVRRRFRESADVLINEFALPTWERRADIVVVNGCIHIYEIKSAGDTLSRLQGQIGLYHRYADQLTIVCAPKHTKAVMKSTPNWVEVIEARGEVRSIQLRQKRSGAPRTLRRKSSLIALMRAPDLVAMLRERGIQLAPKTYRLTLEELAANVPVSALRVAALSSLKKRFGRASAELIRSRRGNVLATDLVQLLRRA